MSRLLKMVFPILLVVQYGMAQNPDAVIETYAAEKIYLQTDAPVYTADERLWFTSTILNASHQPTQMSKVLYAELINAGGKVLDKRKVKITYGKAHGFFDLDEQPPGAYLLRTYTQWNRNFDNAFFGKAQFHIQSDSGALTSPLQDIIISRQATDEVIVSAKLNEQLSSELEDTRLKIAAETPQGKYILNAKKENGIFKINQAFPKDALWCSFSFSVNDKQFNIPLVLNPEYRKIEFYPEGGAMVQGITSRVGFRVTDALGRPRKGTGRIFDHNGDRLLDFHTNEVGMGSFYLSADEAGAYGVLDVPEGKVAERHPLPALLAEGSTLQVEQHGDEFWMGVNRKGKQRGVQITISARGTKYLDLEGKLDRKRTFVTNVEANQLPEGILKVALLDEDGEEIATRLIFHEKLENRLKVVLQGEQQFDKRAKSDFTVKVKNSVGQSVQATGNVMVVNKTQWLGLKDKEESLLSRMLLTTELNETIHTPGAYFNGQRADYQKLDLLLLTSNPETYVYQQPKVEQRFDPEKNLVVSGRVTGNWNTKRARPDVDLTMLTYGNNTGAYEQVTDEKGRFAIEIGDEYGKEMEVLFQSKTGDKNKELTIQLDDYETPTVYYDPTWNIQEPDSVLESMAKENYRRKQVRDAFFVSQGVRDLGAVVVEDYRRSPAREKVFAKHGKPDLVVTHEQIMEYDQNWTPGLYSILKFNIKDIIIRNSPCLGGMNYDIAEVRNCDATVIMVDGKVVQLFNYRYLPNMDPTDIQSVDVIRDAYAFSQVFYELHPQAMEVPAIGAIISIHTISGRGIMGPKKAKGIKTKQYEVFSAEGLYRGPEYEKLTNESWRIPDYRSVVHWQPQVITDEQGTFSTSFYNADLPGEMMVIVEVMSADGRLGYAELGYQVTKKRRNDKAESDDE